MPGHEGLRAPVTVPLSRSVWRLMVAWLTLGWLALFPTLSPAVDSYSFGVVPQYDQGRIHDDWLPILTEVSKRAAVQLVLVGSPRIPEFEKDYGQGRYDFAYMNPYHAVLAHRGQGYIPLVRSGSTVLQGVVVVRSDSPLRRVHDLQGKLIAFPSPNSVAASLLVRAALKRRFGITHQSRYVQTHSSVYLNVIAGTVDAGGGATTTLAVQPPEVRDRLRVLYTTDAMPGHPILAHARVPEPVRLRVQRAFVSLGETAAGRALLDRVPMPDPVATSMRDYQTLDQLGLSDFVVPEAPP